MAFIGFDYFTKMSQRFHTTVMQLKSLHGKIDCRLGKPTI